MTKAQKAWMRQAQALVRGTTIEHLQAMLAKDPTCSSRLTTLAKEELQARGEVVS